MATESTGRSTVRSITFEEEIVGVWFNMENIIEYSTVDKDGATYHTINQHGNGNKNAFSTEGLKTNWGTNITINSKPTVSGQAYKSDWFGVDTDSNTLYASEKSFSKCGHHGFKFAVGEAINYQLLELSWSYTNLTEMHVGDFLVLFHQLIWRLVYEHPHEKVRIRL